MKVVLKFCNGCIVVKRTIKSFHLFNADLKISMKIMPTIFLNFALLQASRQFEYAKRKNVIFHKSNDFKQ